MLLARSCAIVHGMIMWSLSSLKLHIMLLQLGNLVNIFRIKCLPVLAETMCMQLQVEL